MDSMMSAIKARRGSAAPMQEVMPEQEQAPGMKDLLMQLSPEQKEELMGLLAQDASGGGDVSGIENGQPSSMEQASIEAQAAQGGEDEAMSDDVQMGMLDRNSLEKAEAGARPRGLGDRAKMYAASKLKSKGKIK